MVRYCIYCRKYCEKDLDRSFHSFPKDIQLRRQWINILSLSEKIGMSKYASICSDHFAVSDFDIKPSGIRYLKPNSVPSLASTSKLVSFDNSGKYTEDSDKENRLMKENARYQIEDELESAEILQSTHSSSPCEQNNLTSQHSAELEERIVNDVTSSATSSSDVNENSKYINSDEDCENSEIEECTCEDIEEESISETEISKADYNWEPSPTISFDDVATTTSQVTLKRKMEPKRDSTKRYQANPRFVGDLRRDHFTSDHAWQVVQDYVRERNVKRRTLNQKVNRLTRTVENYKKLLGLLKKTGFISIKPSDAAAEDL